MVVDSGAQIPLIGHPQLQSLKQHLEDRCGVTVKWVSEGITYTGGVGGKAKLLGEVEIPIGLAGVPGIITMKVAENAIPPLIPGGFLKAMKANVDYQNNTVTWNELGPGRVSELIELPSEHVVCRVDQSDGGNWTDPRQSAVVHRITIKQYYSDSYVNECSGTANDDHGQGRR